MSEWSDAVDEVNDSVMRLWGAPFTYVRVADGQRFPIDGVLSQAQLDESVMPGRYIRFLMPDDDALPFPPQRGDQIELGLTAYDITEVDVDEYKSYVMMLRKVGA